MSKSKAKAVAIRIRNNGKVLSNQLCVISYDGTTLEPFQMMFDWFAREYYGQELEIDETRYLNAETKQVVSR